MSSLNFEPEKSDQIRYSTSVNQMRVNDPLPLKPHIQAMVEQCGFTEVAHGRGHHEYYSGRVFDLIGYRDTEAYVFTTPASSDRIGVVHTSRETLEAAIQAGRPSLFSEWRSEIMTPEQFVAWRKENDVGFEPKRDATRSAPSAEGFSFAHLPYKPIRLPGDTPVRDTMALGVKNLKNTTQSIGAFFHLSRHSSASNGQSAGMSH